MDGSVLGGVDGTALIDGFTNDIDNSSKCLRTNRHENGCAGILHVLATHEALSGVQGNCADVVATEMLGDLEHKTVLSTLDLKSVEDGREISVELHVDDGTDDLRDSSC